jgi:predicted DNA-binding transcriptional regulator YafY
MADRLERLATLAANLLDTRIPLTLDDIAERVPGYPPDRASFRRQFERDKATLREIGVPVSVETNEFLGTEPGYRIRPEEYALPPLDLTADETAALHVAVEAITVEGDEGRAALWKLGGSTGMSTETLGAIPNLPALPLLFDAYRNRATATFTYRNESRTVDPYGLVFRRGHWYAVGHDHDRDAIRAFRVDRIAGEVELGRFGTFERPADVDPRELISDDPSRFATDAPVDVELRVDAPHVAEAQRRYPDAAMERESDGGAVLTLTVTSQDVFFGSVLGFLDGTEILGPPELRAAFVARLGSGATQ